MLTLRVHGGLCNRLRALLSYRAMHHELTVVWLPDAQVAHAEWGDVFEPLPGVTFESALREVEVTAYEPHPRAHAQPDWVYGYREVRLRSDHAYRLRELRVPMGPYIGIHARRTDGAVHAQASGCYTSDDQLLAWCAEQPPGPVWLATDNGRTQRELGAALRAAGRLVTTGGQAVEPDDTDTSDRRYTSLADSAVDLFGLAGAKAFKGSGDSSFTHCVQVLRAIGGWWS